ncbi:MAG: hypothetical protein KDH94_02665, partial [Coxiellaceae bacterium]|nr:hypothetical protein [Coxiellaceae bacterium]
MRDTYRLPYKHAKAAQKVKDKIDEGAMDYSDLEKLIYAIGFVGAGVLSFFSVEFYLRIGGQGTKYLPFGKFSESFGAKAAFGSNLTFNFYCIMDTLFSARNEYYQYKIATAKDIGLITSKKTTIAKYGIASLGALAAGIMMAVIAGSSDGVGVQAVTLIVNVFLNFLGMRELTNVPSNIKSTYQKFRKKMSWDSEEEQSLLSNNVSADWYLSKLDNSTSIPPLITPNNIFTKKEVV